MQMNDKVMCPYCGPWNGHPDGAEMELETNSHADGTVDMWYGCTVCKIRSPIGWDRDATHFVAMRRFAPMQKPLTLDEVKRRCSDIFGRPLYIEWRPIERFDEFRTAWPPWKLIENVARLIKNESRYNRDFRFWLNEPTDDERRAAGWEE